MPKNEFEIEETKIEGYEWVCPKCKRKITATTEKRVESLAKQHYYTKHP